MSSSASDPLSVGWVRARPLPLGYRNDAVLAVVLFALSLCSLVMYDSASYYPNPAPAWLGVLVVLLQCLPLAWRRRFPCSVLLISSAVFMATQLLQVPEVLVSNISLFIAIYTVGAWGPSRLLARIARVVVIVVMFLWLFSALLGAAFVEHTAGMDTRGSVSPAVAIGVVTILQNLLYFGGAYYFGNRAFTAARERAVLDARTAQLAEERERTAAQAVSLERLRIARELHDVIAHHVSVMGVQAGAARRVLQRNPEQASLSLSAIESSAREAVDELHRMLSTLREEGQPTEAANGPSTHGVDQLTDLVADACSSGLAAGLTIVGEPRSLSPIVSVTVYRIVQEAITNAIKHAGGSATLDVRVRYLGSSVEVEVTDSGGVPMKSSKGSGLGIVGMRERMSAVGGTLEAGPRARGGYLVRADIPTAAQPAGRTNLPGALPSNVPGALPSNVPAEETLPADAIVPAKETLLADAIVPAEGTLPAVASVPANEIVPVVSSVPAKETLPAKETTP